jgi:Component of IIS longevity pathway SMK-1
LKKLGDIFNTTEELHNIESLVNLFFIYKSMLSLGDTKLIETMLSQEYYLDTFGALECNYYKYHIYLDDPEIINNNMNA